MVESWTGWVLCYDIRLNQLFLPGWLLLLASSDLGLVAERAALSHYCRVGGEVRFPIRPSLMQQGGYSFMPPTVGALGPHTDSSLARRRRGCLPAAPHVASTDTEAGLVSDPPGMSPNPAPRVGLPTRLPWPHPGGLWVPHHSLAKVESWSFICPFWHRWDGASFF